MPGEDSARSKKTTQRQFEIMVQFITNHRQMEVRKFSPSFTPQDKENLWNELTELLNADGYGPIKKADKWRKTWTDYKSEIKGKYADMLKERRRTGNNGKEFYPLPPLYQKVLSLIDDVLITGDEDVPETVRNQELDFMHRPGASTEIEHNIVATEPVEESNDLNISEEDLLNTPSNTFMQARKHRKIGSVTQSNRQPGVSRKNFNNLIETETEKTSALLQLSEAVERGNAIKEKELELLQTRNALKEKELELLEKKNVIEQERNQIFATFTDNFAIVSQNFYDVFKNK